MHQDEYKKDDCSLCKDKESSNSYIMLDNYEYERDEIIKEIFDSIFKGLVITMLAINALLLSKVISHIDILADKQYNKTSSTQTK